VPNEVTERKLAGHGRPLEVGDGDLQDDAPRTFVHAVEVVEEGGDAGDFHDTAKVKRLTSKPFLLLTL